MSKSPTIDIDTVASSGATVVPVSGTWANTDERTPFDSTLDPEPGDTHACIVEPRGTPSPRSDEVADDDESWAIVALRFGKMKLLLVTNGYCDMRLDGILKECGCKFDTFTET